MPQFPNGVDVTRLRGTEVDDGYGGKVISWAAPASATIPGVALAPRVGDELHAPGRDGVVVGLTLYSLDANADITYRDRIQYGGTLYEVEGEPGRWSSPYSGFPHGLTVALRRVEG